MALEGTRTGTSANWDIDRYEQLQDAAWELDGWASEQDRNARRSGRHSEGDANRGRASALRQEAAHLLARYWVLPRADEHLSGEGQHGKRRDDARESSTVKQLAHPASNSTGRACPKG